MHRQLRKYLATATGQSAQVIVVFLDVRGFSSFAGMAESSDAAMFLRSAYSQVLDDYFPNAAFFKPTGDGLMVIEQFADDSLEKVLFTSIRSAVRLVENFPTLTSADPMVNVDVPQALGVGIARGAATRLASGRFTLDYSGRPLNLAARLMDLARPRGVVVDQRALKALALPRDLTRVFSSHEVFVKGINDATPRAVLCSREVQIREQNKHPLLGRPHEDSRETMTFKQFKERGRFISVPELEPADPDSIRLLYEYPQPTESGHKSRSIVRTGSMSPIELERTPDGWDVTFDYQDVSEELEELGVRPTWEVDVRLAYTVASTER